MAAIQRFWALETARHPSSELVTYWKILVRRRWIIAVTILITVWVAAFGLLLAPRTYAATTTLQAVTAGAPGDAVNYDAAIYAQRRMSTYVQLATSQAVAAELAQTLGLATPPTIKVESPANSELLRITVQDRDPNLAARAANTLAGLVAARAQAAVAAADSQAESVLREALANLERQVDTAGAGPPAPSVAAKRDVYARLLEQYQRAQIASTLRANSLTVLEPATAPSEPIGPNVRAGLLLALLLGLGGGLGFALLAERLDSRLHTPRQIEAACGLPVIGSVPVLDAGPGQEMPDLARHADLFRQLGTQLLALGQRAPMRTLLFTSARAFEGKSSTVAGLAAALAEEGLEIIVVDANLRAPTLATLLGVSEKPGLGELLVGEAVLEQALQPSRLPGVYVLAAGRAVAGPARLFSAPAMAALLLELGRRSDLVLLDSPALQDGPDAAVLAPHVDGVLLVAAQGRAHVEALQATRAALATAGALLLGIVATTRGSTSLIPGRSTLAASLLAAKDRYVTR